MKLRTRILTGFALVLAIVGGVGIAVVASQRDQLTDQLDRRLEAIVPLDRGGPPGPGPAPDGAPSPDEVGEVRDLGEPAAPISDVYIAEVTAGGDVTELVVGQLLETTPDVSSVTVDFGERRTFVSVDGVDGSTRFRVLAEPSPTGVTVVFAIPSTDVDETVDRLILTFALAALGIATLLGVLAWWVVRLGLRPISTVAETAHAVAEGDRERRAPELDERTEAGELAAAFNIMLDQRDAAEDRLRRFASDASHELRTPLTSIRGYLDLYAAGGFREEGQLDDVVRRMQDEAGRMGVLVEDLLQLARYDEGQQLALAPVDVAAVVTDVVANASVANRQRSITSDVPDGGVTAMVDRDRITQLVVLLVDNALTHAPDATVQVRASSTADEVRIEVVDDGPGMDAESADQVFTRFFRGDASRTRETGGSGLGLAIAQSITEAHGGSIELQTAPGEGCRFEVVLPSASGSA